MWARSKRLRRIAWWRPGGSVGRAFAAALACILTGCAVGPEFHAPRAPAMSHYSTGDPVQTVAAQGIAQRFTTGAQVDADWWHLFKSSQLDELIKEALANNPWLEAARASLRQSEDALRSGYGIFYPSLDADAAATRQRYSPVGQRLPGSLFNLFTLSASVSYALDVFGGQRRTVEALGAQVDVQRAGEQGAYLTLIANIVNTAVAGAAYREQIEATQQLIDLQRQQVKLAQVQVIAGTTAYSSVLSLQSQLASLEATIPQLEQKLSQSDDLLATLAGYAPAQWQPPHIRLADLTLPADLPVSVPSDLVRQRPDILAAQATAHAASANIGVATAALLPAVNLSGSYSANSTTTDALFSTNGRAWSVGGDVTAPLFQGGMLWFRRKAAVDSYQQAMASYRQTVLSAFGQVADILRALDHDARALQAQDAALAAAKEALRLVEINYEAGLNTYLDVLSADAQYHQSVINDLQAIALRYQDTVALYVALGGGWWHLPS
ncbi:MAG TPA: efflux transporter outer membrane subunit [Steroidobacteraceae bacterium]